MKNSYLLFIVILLAYENVMGQDNAGAAQQSQDSKLESISKTPAKSGLSYEALTQFYQTTFTSGKSGGFKFKSSLFGIQKLFSSKDLDLSQYYLAKKGARNFEVSLGVDKNKDNNVDNVRAGLKYGIINNRSKSDVNFTNFEEIGNPLQNLGRIQNQAGQVYFRLINAITDPAERELRRKEFMAANEKFKKSLKVSDLPNEIVLLIDSISKSQLSMSAEELFAAPQKAYDIRAKKVDQQSLLTLEFSPGYSWNKKRWDSTSVVVQYLKGFGNYERPWNFDGQLKNHFLRDTLGKPKNLSRSIAVVQIGLNKILAIDDKKNPLIEFELAFEDNYVHRGVYNGEDRNKLSFNTIFRVHITKEITVPLTLKYDLNNPNVFGFLQFNWNLENKRNNDTK